MMTVQNSTVWVLLCQVNVCAQMFLGIANLIENDPATFYELKCNLSEQGIFPFHILVGDLLLI